MRRDHCLAAAAMTLIVLSSALSSAAQESPAALPQTEQPPENAAKGAGSATREPTVTVFERDEVQGILGREVRSTTGENMGRIVDVIVDQAGQVKAAIIDFGGFLGVGSRKIAVAWNAFRFPPNAKGSVGSIALELMRDQVRAAPEYKEDKPVVVLGPSGSLESLPMP